MFCTIIISNCKTLNVEFNLGFWSKALWSIFRSMIIIHCWTPSICNLVDILFIVITLPFVDWRRRTSRGLPWKFIIFSSSLFIWLTSFINIWHHLIVKENIQSIRLWLNASNAPSSHPVTQWWICKQSPPSHGQVILEERINNLGLLCLKVGQSLTEVSLYCLPDLRPPEVLVRKC